MVSDMINGKMPMIPEIAVGMVDVRDVAKVHVRALSVPEAAGQRFILASEEPVEMMHLAKTLKEAGFSKVSTAQGAGILAAFHGAVQRRRARYGDLLGA